MLNKIFPRVRFCENINATKLYPVQGQSCDQEIAVSNPGHAELLILAVGLTLSPECFTAFTKN